jgi:hypothetical protein
MEIIFGHHILNIYLRHLFYFMLNFLCDKPNFTSIQKYGFHAGIKYPNLTFSLDISHKMTNIYLIGRSRSIGTVRARTQFRSVSYWGTCIKN